MHTFVFKAKKPNGQILSGKLKAKTKNEVLYILNDKKLQPIIVEVQKNIFSLGSGGASGIPTKHLVTFTRQLAFLINAGIPVVQALRLIKETMQNPKMKGIINNIVSSIDGGSTFSNALSDYPSVFSNMYINIINSGEVGGSLDTMLTRLAEYIEDSEQLKSRVKKAMMYPSFVLGIGLLIVGVIMVVVVPKFVSIFEGNNMELPFITQLLINMSNFFKSNVLVLVVTVVALPFGFILYLRSPSGRKLKDQLILLMPIFGSLSLKNGLARFSKTLSCLLAGGVSIVDALDTAALTANNFFIEKAIQNVRSKVIKGKSVAGSLRKERIIPVMVSNMVAIGEETGSTDATLEKVAEFYEEQVKSTTGAISDLIQPFLIAILGAIVGFVVIALYLPIFKMPGIAGGF